jgi:hypothetical protein
MLKNLSPSWTQAYYNAIEGYFWSPSLIGRAKTGKTKPWHEWHAGLLKKELPLNHILNLFFALTQQGTRDRCVSHLTGIPLTGMQFVPSVSVVRTVSAAFTQPDLIFASASRLAFVELKVGSASDLDQFAKYVRAGLLLREKHPEIQAVHLAVVTSPGREATVWGSRQFADIATLKAKVQSMLLDESAAWQSAAMQKFARDSSAEAKRAMAEAVEATSVRVVSYNELDQALAGEQSRSGEEDPLVSGLRSELSARKRISSATASKLSGPPA